MKKKKNTEQKFEGDKAEGSDEIKGPKKSVIEIRRRRRGINEGGRKINKRERGKLKIVQ